MMLAVTNRFDNVIKTGLNIQLLADTQIIADFNQPKLLSQPTEIRRKLLESTANGYHPAKLLPPAGNSVSHRGVGFCQ